jgi:hypothetical protein
MAGGGFINQCRAQHRATISANLVTLFRTGMSQQAICKEVGMGGDSLRAILREAGVIPAKAVAK